MGLTRIRAEQISDIDYKQAVRVITVSNINLGAAPSQVDGVNLVVGDRVLVAGQDPASQNGLYVVDVVGSGSTGQWSRTSDANQTGEIEAGMIVMVTEGDIYDDTQWKLVTDNPIIIGVTPLIFEQNSAFAFGNIVANGVAVLADTVGDSVTFAAGNNMVIVGNASSTSVTFAVSDSPAFSGNVTVTNIFPSGNNLYDLGSDTQRFRSLYVSGNTIYVGSESMSTDNDGTWSFTSGSSTVTLGENVPFNAPEISALGNITGGNITSNAGVYSDTATFTGNVDVGNLNAVQQVAGSTLRSTNSNGDEGGEIFFTLPATNTTLSTGVTVDVWRNKFRIFETGGTQRGGFFDLATCNAGVATNFAAGGGGSTPGGSNTQVQFNDEGVFAGTNQLTFNKTTNVLSTTGTFTATGNITGGNVIGTNLVGTLATASQPNITSVGTLTGLTLSGTLTGTTINAQNIGNTGANLTGTLQTQSQPNITTVGTLSSVTVTGNVDAGAVSASGNISGNYFLGNGSALTGIVAGLTWTTQANTAPSNPKPGDFWYDSFADIKYQYTNDGSSNIWIDQSYPTSFSTLTVQNIVNGGANGTGNIGTSVGYFNTAFVKATSAQYADLAEVYEADETYSPGTVVVFGGDKEITISNQSHDTKVAGVISTNPAFIMNSHALGLPVAFTGRVPCRVQGPVDKGDVLVTGELPGVAQKITHDYQPGCVLGKSLQSIDDNSIQTIEVVVGRF